MSAGHQKLWILIIYLTTIRIGLYCQNKIYNSDFNKFTKTYNEELVPIYNPTHWTYNYSKKPHPIYFSTDRFFDNEIRYKFHPDAKLLKNGKKLNYIGLPILPYPCKISTKLKDTLISGKKYVINLDIKFFSNYNCFTDLIYGFSNKKDESYEKLVFKVPDSLNCQDLYEKWNTISTTYEANGDEIYFHIGTNKPEDYEKTKSIDKSSMKKCINIKYCLDNIRIIPLNYQELKIEKFGIRKNDSIIILKDINFHINESQLKDNSFHTLNDLIKYLKRNNYNINIYGHTDNTGTKEFNKRLSLSRAKSVANYLINKGIEKDRIKYYGCGSEEPTSSNKTKSGRKTNRRVEIEIFN